MRLFVLSPAKEVLDPDLGYIHAPYAEVLRTYEGYARFDLDSFGLNNDPLPEPLPDKRVFVVGDSFVESYQVMRSENFVSRLGKAWSDSLLFNAGVSGASPDASVNIVNRLYSVVSPTHILLCVNASDLYELLQTEEIRDSKGRLISLQRPHEAMSGFKSFKLFIYAHSALITHLKWKYESEIRGWLTKGDVLKEARKAREMTGEQLAKVIERWRFVLRQLQLTGAHVSILMMPELEYLPMRKARQINRQEREILSRETELMGVPLIESNPVMARDFEMSGLPGLGFANTSYGKGHINRHGHLVLANWLASQRHVILR